ncbi:hypothetical protein [Wukongibacter sp. M2B1]|uniref:hypothetical protein n=1 Tax=Wukongibacter sp. M2B1 TaxID=3088895 RepID=UPI003D7BB8BA
MELRLKKTYFFEKDFGKKFGSLLKENAMSLSKTQKYDITIRYYYYEMSIEKTVFDEFKEAENSKDRLYKAVKNQVEVIKTILHKQNIEYCDLSIYGERSCEQLDDINIIFKRNRSKHTSVGTISIVPNVNYTLNNVSNIIKDDFLEIYDEIPNNKFLAIIFGLPVESDINKIFKTYSNKFWIGIKKEDETILNEIRDNIEQLNEMVMANDSLLADAIKEFNENLMWEKIEEEFQEKYGRDSIFNK